MSELSELGASGQGLAAMAALVHTRFGSKSTAPMWRNRFRPRCHCTRLAAAL